MCVGTLRGGGEGEGAGVGRRSAYQAAACAHVKEKPHCFFEEFFCQAPQACALTIVTFEATLWERSSGAMGTHMKRSEKQLRNPCAKATVRFPWTETCWSVWTSSAWVMKPTGGPCWERFGKRRVVKHPGIRDTYLVKSCGVKPRNKEPSRWEGSSGLAAIWPVNLTLFCVPSARGAAHWRT